MKHQLNNEPIQKCAGLCKFFIAVALDHHTINIYDSSDTPMKWLSIQKIPNQK